MQPCESVGSDALAETVIEWGKVVTERGQRVR
jgi:hypothetical protein